MRGTTLSRLQESHANDHIMATPPAAGRSNAIPSIRLVAATPSNAGSSFESNVSSPTFHVPQASTLPSLPETILPSPLAPSPANRKRVVPKKSKLSMLGKAVRTREAKERDLSDVVRRVGASSASARGGFDIFVDPTEDPEIGEIVMVKKKKSRVALDSIFGESSSKSTAPMKDATNNAALPQKKQSTGPMSLLKRSTGAASVLKSEDENSQKWWSMSRGRKDSKPKAKAETPKSDSRNRFNSLDSGVLLNSPIACDLPAELQAITERQTNGAAKLSFASSPKPSSMGRSISFSPMTALEAAPPMIKAHSMIPTGDNTGCIATPPPILRASSMIPSGNNTGLLVPPPAVPPGAKDASNTGSIAVRAMRSMRSLATISSWAQLKDGSVRGSKEKEEKPAKEAKPKKEKASKKGKADTVRAVSGSSFEVGALSPPETSPVQANSERTKNLGDRKRSVLGLGMGWPSTLRSASSPVVAAAVPAPVVHVSAPVETETVASRPPPSAFSTVRMSSDAKRLSSDSHLSSSSAEGILASTVGRARAGSRSTMSSTNSSLRPLSSASGHSAGSCGSSAISVRWDEEGLATVKEARKRERATRRGPMESRRGSEERKRNSLASVFPETREQIRTASGGYKPAPEEDEEEDRPAPPIVNIETATTADGHSIREDIADSEYENDEGSMPSRTPQRLPRPRPLSEQLLGQMRPRAMTDDSEGVLSILDAATNELASLIGRLDLQATPATPDISPLRADSLSSLLKSVASTNAQSAQGSPTKASKKQIDSPLKRPAQLLRGMSASSITSLHTYEETRKAKASAGPSAIGKGSMLGQEIAPRQLLNQSISPGRPRVPSQVKPMVRPGHERSLTPAEVDVPVLQPLRPPTHRAIAARPTLQATTPSKSSPLMMPHGSATFGRGAARKVAAKLSFGAESIDSDINASPTPVFHHRPGHARKRSSLVPASPPSTVRITRDIKPLQPSVLDLFGGGVVRGSVANGREMPINSRNPASDIPDDLHDIIAARAGLLEEDSGEESLSDVPPSPGAPPVLPLPIPTRAPMLPPLGLSLEVPMLCLIDEEQRLSDIEALSPITSDEDNTRKSFEFTAELNRLNESGASDRRSFVEQLANAFDTPAKIDILKFGEFLAVDAPPVPKLPQTFEQQLSITDEVSGPDSILDSTTATSVSDLVSGDSLISSTTASEEELDSGSSLEVARAPQSARSEGELNRHFRFGGRPSPSDVPSSVANTSAQLTLSDILPSPEHVRRLSMGGVDDSAVESIFAAAQASPASQRERVDSESMSQRRERNLALNALNGGKVADASFRPMSQASFAGFDSFDDVRRNFEFGRDRPAFYPAPAAAGSRHKVQDSMFSVASVSSYGSAWDAGSRDPFGYTAPSRPQSTSDMSFSFSMSGTVDDTFRFLKHDPMPTRNRVDSDASTFSFHAPAQDAPMPIYTRPTHRRDQSTASISSMAPPVSMHNRSFGHRRNASSGSASSFAMSYALHGAAGGRAAWARHRPQISIDSVISEVSALHVARPGLSDKMFDSAPMHNYGAPLSAISGSPANSEAGDMSEYQSEFASSYPYNFAIDAESQAVAEDSLFEKTDYKTGTVEDSLFEKTQFKTGTVEDSLFEKTGYKSPTFDNSSVFGGVEDDTSYMPSVRPFRPVSILSTGSVHHAPQDDDTMISMIGGGHVRRLSIGSLEGSPCVRIEKEKRMMSHIKGIKGVNLADRLASMREVTEEPESSPRIVEKPSTSSFQFGDDRMEQARKGVLKRDSLEMGCLSADGEDTSLSSSEQPVSFRRPVRGSRVRSNTYASSGAETPPLSAADNSSVSGGSESSIDVSHLTMLLANMSHPTSNLAYTRARTRVRGHRRRISQARASRSSIIETIEEEQSVNLGLASHLTSISASPAPAALAPAFDLSVADKSIVVVDSDADSRRSSLEWDPNHGLSLRRYHALKHEATDAVEESKRVWSDTPFSLFALQAFDPPHQPEGMKAMLAHSKVNFNELPPTMLGRHPRSRTTSRASPYVRAAIAAGVSPTSLSGHSRESSDASVTEVLPMFATRASVLQPVIVHTNMPSPAKSVRSTKSAKAKKALKPLKLVELLPENEKISAPRTRVNSNVRRSALGWVKRAPKSSADQKENTSAGPLMNPNESLKINRPRPRGRPTPARTIRA